METVKIKDVTLEVINLNGSREYQGSYRFSDTVRFYSYNENKSKKWVWSYNDSQCISSYDSLEDAVKNWKDTLGFR